MMWMMLGLLAGPAEARDRDLLPAAANTAVSSDAKVALVIGNGRYEDAAASLANPPSDAALMARTLRGLGFEVTVLTDLGQVELKRAIDAFGAQISGGGVALFYYAGHGLQVDGRNWLVPTDAAIGSAADVEYNAVDVGRVLAKMDGANSGLNIVVLDACRNNPFERSWSRSGQGSGLAAINAPTGTLIAYATAPGSVAADGLTDNSPYTAALTRSMTLPGMELASVFRNARSEVISTTGEKQTPWESSSYTGNFFFVPAAPEPAPEAHAAGNPAPDAGAVVSSICWYYNNYHYISVRLDDTRRPNDGIPFGSFREPSFACQSVEPGRYVLSASGHSAIGAADGEVFEVLAGQTLYLQISAYKRSIGSGTVANVFRGSQSGFEEIKPELKQVTVQ